MKLISRSNPDLNRHKIKPRILERFGFVVFALLTASVTALSPSARAANAPPHNISAANLNVVQNDSDNTEASVTVTATLSINDLRVRPGSNRGDYNVQVGDTATNDLADGFILVAMSENGRDNLELESQLNYTAPAFDGNGNGYWAVVQDVTSSRAEYNMNCAVAYFRYTNWICGWARNATGANGGANDLFSASPGLVLDTHLKKIANGRYRVDLRGLGINSGSSGVLLVNHAKNEGNFALSLANPDGTWEVYVKDNFGNASNPYALEQDPLAFVFVPKTNTLVVSGKFGLDDTGTNAVVLMHSGSGTTFAVTNIETGRYRLTIPGFKPADGVLITSAEGGYTNNFDNVVSYQADEDGWVIESRDTGVFPPPLEACTNEPVASFIFIPAATPGFTVNPAGTQITTEFGGTVNYTLVMDTAPTNDVTVNLSSSNPSEGTVAPGSITFTPENWNVPQQFTVTGQDDAVADGPVAYSIILSPVISDDTRYSGLDPADIPVVNVDNDQAGITVSPLDGLFTSEGGSNATFSVFLNRQPTADVVVGLSSDNPLEGTASPSSLTFTPTDWSTPQLVTVSGVDDVKQDGTISYHVVTAPAVSSDLSYNGIDASDVAIQNLDNDSVGFIVSVNLPLTVAEQSSTTYSIALGTQPDSDVVVQIISSDTSAGTVSPDTLTFTPSDWSTPKIVTVFGTDDFIQDGSVPFFITNNVVTMDTLYTNQTIAFIPAISLDNETEFKLPSGDCIYGLGMPPIGIDGQASVEDVDTLSFNNGSLTFGFTANGTVQDVLAIRDIGNSAGQISTSGNEVRYAGVTIGDYSGGDNLTPLVISLNANATPAAVQALARSVTFQTAANAISLATRTLTVTLNDGLGASLVLTKAIRVGALRLTQYQEGGDYGYGQYYGAADIALSQVGSFTPWPEGRTKAPQEGLLIDWPDGGTPNASQVLLRFEDFVGTNYWQVPSNAIVVSAELLVKVNNTGDGGTFHRMLIPWDATNDTWNSLGDGVQTDDIEARSVYESQLGVEDGSGATGTGIISIGVTPDIQAWVNGDTNYGWVMTGWPLRTDGTGFSPSEVPTVGDRPRLRVLWLKPEYQVASFRQGEDGYEGTVDTNLRQSTPDTDYSADTVIWSDAADAGGTNTTQCLLRFDNIVGGSPNQIPPGAHIVAAMLDVANVASDAMGDGGEFYTMLQPWDASASTWSFWVNGIQPDGIEAATTPTVVAGNSDRDPDVQGAYNSFEVTSDVQAWADGVRPNYGWAVLPWPNGSNGWGISSSEYYSFVSDEHPEMERPRLRVFYTTTVATGPAMLMSPVVSPTQVQVRFMGTIGSTYTVLRATSLDGSWSPIGTATVDAGGQGTLVDASPVPGGAFYKVVYP